MEQMTVDLDDDPEAPERVGVLEVLEGISERDRAERTGVRELLDDILREVRVIRELLETALQTRTASRD